MKPRIISRRILANTHGFHVRQTRSQSTLSQRLSVVASSKASKGQVLNELSRYALTATKRVRHESSEIPYSTVILASRDFTSWLEDETFMSKFLETLFKPMSDVQANYTNLSVLYGITDSLSPYQQSGEHHSGFSILCGQTENILPGLWEKEGFSNTNLDSTSCVSFKTNPLAGDTKTLEVTLPLANTVFQNGRRSTLYASRWDYSSEGSFALGLKSPKTTQQIAPQGISVNHTTSIIPLLPLTPPRKIIAGLGNIVRQVEVDGSATPASKELEALIPAIFEERTQSDLTSSTRPIGVWCWVIPPHVIEAKKLDNLKLFRAGSSQTETEIALGSMEIFSELLSSGCRLHKILSGGGGWGLKQGLLSLDPETSFSLPGQDDDIETFIKSFQERNSANPTNGLVTPGSFLLFCVEPHLMDKDTASSRLLASTNALTLGVMPNADQALNRSSDSDAIEIIDNHFGVNSATCLFLRSSPEVIEVSGKSVETGTVHSPYTTKVDVPGAYFYV
ncbi:hypothetical protein F5Y19DRAFT_46486 [Xylariaceae sp. FL1651]|nr:hypothetical protein F5Y19DRAFT_46486 [Xylariaceae sp. FL1651]